MNGLTAILWALALWNIVTFALYGIDKYNARKNRWRISEATLLACAFLMGGAGALLGMNVFRHKTRRRTFTLLVPLAVIITIGFVIGFVYFVR